jgi:DNA-binding CsgD family transcriptional regulator
LISLGHLQIGSGYGEMRRYDIAMPALGDAIAFAESRELITHLQYATAWLARCELELGDWDSAAPRASTLVHNERCAGISRFVASVTLGWIRGRRGDPDVWPPLDDAADLAGSTGHLQRLWPAAAARAEVAWLAGRIHDEADLIQRAAAMAAELDYRPAIEELAHWQHLSDGLPRPFDDPRTPFGMSAAGHADRAAQAWAIVGCPYEEAMARFLTGDPAQLLAAHRIFDGLGANPMRSRVAAGLRELGIAVPRGPTNATRDNPFALTARELEVLALVATGRTDREIAGQLVISTKTVGHHVSHLLAKLDVPTRSAAAALAERLRLLGPN